MGGIDQVGAIKLDLIRRLAAIVVQCELLESATMQGQKVDISVLCTLASTSVRISSRLGLERVAKDVTTLEQYLAERDEIADRDVVQRLDELNVAKS